MKSWYVYILKLSDQTLYTGITNNIIQRMKKHRLGKGSKYVYGRLPLKLVYMEEVANRSVASKRESQIKKLNKKQKIALIAKTKIGGTR